ncbi:hypothetical protein SLS62_003993 [Diatrype stigma]|uniref:6-phosphogluconolactonase n=1 Tax=Diatrype stigma TaxID=117547 RepID=A0AAN9UVV0_9PEZI
MADADVDAKPRGNNLSATKQHPSTNNRGLAFTLATRTTALLILVYSTWELANALTRAPPFLAVWRGASPTGFLSPEGVAHSTSFTGSLVKLLYVTSYAGTLTTLKLTATTSSSSSDGLSRASLETVSATSNCGPSPSWVTLDTRHSLLFCADEGLGRPTGFVTSYETSSGGVLVLLDRIEVLAGAVAITPYGRELLYLSISVSGGSPQRRTGELELVQNETYALAHPPGPDPVRQEAPHPHDAIVDPTGQYLLVPDLGADLVRVFKLDRRGRAATRTPLPPVVASPGSGPRHGAFVRVPTTAPDGRSRSRTFFYLVSELANTITGYEVVYHGEGEGTGKLDFDEQFTIGTHGEGEPVPEGAAVAEIQVTPDGRFLIVSSRNESSSNIPHVERSRSNNGDSNDNIGGTPSDSLISFRIHQTTGLLTKLQEFPAGGLIPRHFSVSADGSLVAVGLQGDGRVVVISRNLETGKLEDYIAYADVEGEVTAVIFDE